MRLKYLVIYMITLALTGCNFNPLSSVNSSSSDFQCMQDGKPCDDVQSGNSTITDTSEPVLSDTAQVGSVDSSTKSVILSTKTNIRSNCRYDYSDKNFNLLSLSFLSDTAGVTHSSLMAIETNKDYQLFVRCRSLGGIVNSRSQVIKFSTRAANVESAPVLSQLAPNGILPYTGPSVELRLMTNKLSQCRYDQGDKDYDLMNASFNRDANGILHTKSIPVLASTSYQFFVRCIDSKGIKSNQSGLIRFAVNKDNTDRVAPIISNVVPLNTTYPGETTSVTLGLNTNEKSICKFSNMDSVYASMPGVMISNASGTQHNQQVVVKAATDYRYYFKCSDQYGNVNTSSQMASFKIDIKQAKDTTAPVISGLLPKGELSGETKQVELQVFTNEDAICRYDITDSNYSSLNMLFGAIGRNHKKMVTVKEETDYRFYIRCVDTSGNQSPASSLIFFKVRKAIPQDMAAPVISGISPSGNEYNDGTTQVPLSFMTDEDAICKYATSSGTSFDQMMMMAQTNLKSHLTTLSGLESGMAYEFFIKCSDKVGNISGFSTSKFSVKKEVSLNGVQLYANNCAGCHSAGDTSLSTTIASSKKRGVTAKATKDAIYITSAGNPMSFIQSLKQLSDAQLEAIAKALEVNAGAEPVSCDENVDNMAPLTRRLTKVEISNSFEALLGKTSRPDLSSIPADGKSRYGITRNGKAQGGYSPEATARLYDIFSESVSKAIAANAIAPTCSSMSGNSLNTCLNQNLFPLIERAWRRVLTSDQKQLFYSYFNNKSFSQGISMSLLMTFLSPKFLFISYDDDVVPRKLNRYEVAERLSFLVTGRVPTQELMDTIKTKDLSIKANLLTEMRKMFDSGNVTRKTDLRRNYGWSFFLELQNQWLDIDKLAGITPNLKDVNYNAGTMMWANMFYLEEMFRRNRTINQMMTDNFVVVTEGIDHLVDVNFADGVEAEYDIYHTPHSFRKVTVPASKRKGLLTQSAVLAINAHSNVEGEVNPTMRGLWHAQKILCDLPGGVPANITFDDDIPLGVSLKKKMEAHVKKGGACIECHKIMDPVGFGLWGYDPLGRSRTVDTWGFPVDPSGELEGEFFQTVSQMLDIIAKSKKTEQCVMSHLTSFIVARDVESNKSCVAQRVMNNVKAKNGGLNDILEEIVTSDLFLMRKK